MFEIPKAIIPDSAKLYRPPQIKLTLHGIKNRSDDELMMLLSGEGRERHYFSSPAPSNKLRTNLSSNPEIK